MADAVKLKQLKALDFANQAYAGSTDTVPDGKYAPEVSAPLFLSC